MTWVKMMALPPDPRLWIPPLTEGCILILMTLDKTVRY